MGRFRQIWLLVLRWVFLDPARSLLQYSILFFFRFQYSQSTVHNWIYEAIPIFYVEFSRQFVARSPGLSVAGVLILGNYDDPVLSDIKLLVDTTASPCVRPGPREEVINSQLGDVRFPYCLLCARCHSALNYNEHKGRHVTVSEFISDTSGHLVAGVSGFPGPFSDKMIRHGVLFMLVALHLVSCLCCLFSFNCRSVLFGAASCRRARSYCFDHWRQSLSRAPCRDMSLVCTRGCCSHPVELDESVLKVAGRQRIEGLNHDIKSLTFRPTNPTLHSECVIVAALLIDFLHHLHRH